MFTHEGANAKLKPSKPSTSKTTVIKPIVKDNSADSTWPKQQEQHTPAKCDYSFDSDVIPDTPNTLVPEKLNVTSPDVVPNTPETDTKHRSAQGRSFLSSSHSLTSHSLIKSLPKHRIIKTAKRASSATEKLKKPVSEVRCSWDSGNVDMNCIMTEMGLPSVSKATEVPHFSEATDISDVEIKKLVDRSCSGGVSALRGKMIAEASLKATRSAKRNASSTTGESPKQKRKIAADHDCVDFVADTQMEEEEEEEEVKDIKPRKTFHWERKIKKDRIEKPRVNVKDQVLSDILNELKKESEAERGEGVEGERGEGVKEERGEDVKGERGEDLKSLTHTEDDIRPVTHTEDDGRLVTLTSAKDLETLEVGAAFADDALDDIMGELKQSLNKQNQRSVQGKKVGKSFTRKPLCHKLNINKENDHQDTVRSRSTSSKCSSNVDTGTRLMEDEDSWMQHIQLPSPSKDKNKHQRSVFLFLST